MEITANKIGKPIYLALIDAIMCGILIQLSVDLKEKGSITTILCIMCFILCGFEHCIANMFYFVAGVTISNAAMCLLYVFVYIIGNSIGGICMKLFTKEGIYKHENN